MNTRILLGRIAATGTNRPTDVPWSVCVSVVYITEPYEAADPTKVSFGIYSQWA